MSTWTGWTCATLRVGSSCASELETLPDVGCSGENGDNYALWCSDVLEVAIDIPAAGSYELDVVAWADHAGDELPRLRIAVESNTEDSAGARVIRAKLVELFDKLLGVQATPHSPDVEAVYQLFVDVQQRRRKSGDVKFEHWRCGLNDMSYFDGILDDAVVVKENDDGHQWYSFDWDRLNDFWDSIDRSDPYHSAEAWVVVLTALLMDYRYLYL